ncbi:MULTISPECIES: DUF402 domain-containing protein [Breznakia]|uniref:DUF402 domain-containing protein n=1 Tax=Breznakia blatticola TaxID=1754012 RepID=A0A4R8A3F6_9FIRM|nr:MULTISPECIES: DUF402 domain-containing protein [Breznakia]MDH6367668.1 protein associated with RNAse G/E [Breznakia sp. PH1-1]MDH6404739.1 protein associated with RNAse G/E [Breznakia sp. PF1-11]MDH6412454.1 protein associated with RNAse G/E [Breznakia sp. PFB1-11]MDH6414814.1 protein associated with RNAse G/E [Breznakia sp. PFB1-14]MDH6417142.1 protein associated with RNAse G/E [Breznakia sp. PFB1-4]
MLPKENEYVYIQSYKHDGSIHRTWSKAFVIESNKDRIVAITDRAYVVEADGRKWLTREPAICFFYPNHWYNVISMIRKHGVFYYCNLASPSIYDGEAIKNIDYDLDIKVSNTYEQTLLDEDEYEEHGAKMHYSKELDTVIWKELRDLQQRIDRKESPFDHREIERLYNKYLIMKEEWRNRRVSV